MPRRNKRVTIRATSVPELHQSQGHNGTKKQAKDLHI